MKLDQTMIHSEFHMHTCFSTDSDASVESMLDACVKRGIVSVCITDHMDKDYPPDPELGENPFQFDLDAYFSKLTALKEKYSKKLNLRIGMEIGMQKHLGEVYHKMVQSYPFDFIIGSLHLVGGMDPYYGKIFEGRSDEAVYREAFIETAECLDRISDFDVLGHLDYVVRYGRHQAGEYSYRKFSDEIDLILRKLIDSGKGLEMNMGGIKYGLGFPNPHPDVLKRYRELGGSIITTGSDAHMPEHVGYAFEKAGEILKSCGFRYYTEFKERKPVFLEIP